MKLSCIFVLKMITREQVLVPCWSCYLMWWLMTHKVWKCAAIQQIISAWGATLRNLYNVLYNNDRSAWLITCLMAQLKPDCCMPPNLITVTNTCNLCQAYNINDSIKTHLKETEQQLCKSRQTERLVNLIVSKFISHWS